MGIFKNSIHQKQFDENGFIILPLVSHETIVQLKKLHQEQFTENDNRTYAFNAESESAKNDYIATRLIELLAESFDKVLVDYVNHGGTFFTKVKGYGELPLHQDTTVVEPGAGFYTWIPLQDVTEQNGCMFIVEKSHRFFENYVSFTYPNESIPRDTIQPQYVTKLEMKAGEILFLNGRMFHGSFENNTTRHRVAVNVSITKADTRFVYYQKKNEFTASEYFVTAESYRNSYKTYSAGELPAGAIFSRDIPYKHISINNELLNNKCIELLPHKNSLFSKLKQLVESLY